MYQPRRYRACFGASDLVAFGVTVEASDLHIQAESDLTTEALEATRRAYDEVARHIRLRPEFATSLSPLTAPGGVSDLIRGMYESTAAVGVGPMASVAGAVAQYVGRALLAHTGQVIVENGGDLFLSTKVERLVAVYASSSPLSGKVGLVIPAGETLGICTSSGTEGHSLSFGRADAALIAANDAAFADAAASGLGNRVTAADDIEGALAWASEVDGVRAALVIIGDKMGVWGEFEVGPVES